MNAQLAEARFPILLTLLLAIAMTGVGMTQPIFNHFVPIYLKEMGLATTLITFVLTWDNLINMFLQPIVGQGSDRTRTRIGRRKPWVLVGVPIAGTAFLFVPMMSTPGGIMLTIFLTNFGMALARSPGVALIGDLYPSHQRSLANGIIVFTAGIGAGLAYYVGGVLYGMYGRQAPFLFGTMTLALALGIIVFLIREPPVPHADSDEKEASLKEVLRSLFTLHDPSLRWMLLAVLCWFMGFTALEALLSLIGREVLGIEPDRMGQLVALLPIALVVGALPSGVLATWFGRRRVILMGLAGLTCVLVYGYFVQTPAMMVGFLVPAGLLWSMVIVNALPTLYDTVPVLRAGLLTGLYYFASNLSAVLGPQLAGLLVDLTDKNYRVVFLYGAVFMGLAILCMTRVRVR